MGLAPTCTGFTGRPRTGLRSSTIKGPEGPQSPRQDLNLRSPAPEAGALARLRYSKNSLFQSPRQDSNLRSPAPKAGALASLRYSEMGPEGLEPSRRWLRARDAAANTLVPSFYL